MKTIGMKWNKYYQCWWCVTLCCCRSKFSPVYWLQTTQTSSSVVTRAAEVFSWVTQALFLDRTNLCFLAFEFLGIWLFLLLLEPVGQLEEFSKLYLNGSLQRPSSPLSDTCKYFGPIWTTQGSLSSSGPVDTPSNCLPWGSSHRG